MPSCRNCGRTLSHEAGSCPGCHHRGPDLFADRDPIGQDNANSFGAVLEALRDPGTYDNRIAGHLTKIVVWAGAGLGGLIGLSAGYHASGIGAGLVFGLIGGLLGAGIAALLINLLAWAVTAAMVVVPIALVVGLIVALWGVRF